MDISFLLDVALMDRLAQANVIAGIIMAICGAAIAVLATRIVLAFSKNKEVAPANGKVIFFKSLGLVLVLAGLIVMILW